MGVKDEAKAIAVEDIIDEELEDDNDRLEYQIEEKEDELEDKEEQAEYDDEAKTEDEELIIDQGEIIEQQSEENQQLREEVNATKEKNKELKDQNELLKEDAVFFIADDAEEADDVVNALEESIKISRPTKSQQERTWVSTKEINATYDQLSGLLLSVASMCVFVSMFFIVSMAMGFILIKWKRTQIANYWIRDLSKILGRREKADKSAIIKEEANRMALDNGDIIYTGKTDVCQA